MLLTPVYYDPVKTKISQTHIHAAVKQSRTHVTKVNNKNNNALTILYAQDALLHCLDY